MRRSQKLSSLVRIIASRQTKAVPGKAVGGAGVGTAMGTPTLPLPLFSRLLLRLLLGWLPPLLPLLWQFSIDVKTHTNDNRHQSRRIGISVQVTTALTFMIARTITEQRTPVMSQISKAAQQKTHGNVSTQKTRHDALE